MALLTLPRTPTRRPKHAAKTPFWRQIGIGRARHNLTAQPLVTPPPADSSPGAASGPVPVSAEQAREVVERLFPPDADGLYPLDWRYFDRGHAIAQVDPGLVPEAARNVVLAYAAAMDAPFVQETEDDRLHLRVSRTVDRVQVTVWADITPEPQEQLALPAAELAPDPELPIEREVRCVLDETQTFDPITDDMDDPREHQDADPDAAPDGDRPAPPPTEQDHPSNPDAAHADLTDEPGEERAVAAEPSETPEEEPADESDEEAA